MRVNPARSRGRVSPTRVLCVRAFRTTSFRATSICTFQVPISRSGHPSSLIYRAWQNPTVSPSPVLTFPHLSSETLGLKVLLPSLQVLSMTSTKKLHIFKIPFLLCPNLVVDVHLYLRLWPQHYLYATRCPTTSEISRRQFFNLLMPYYYHFPSRGTSFQLSFSSRRPFFTALSNQSCPETSRAA